MQMSIAESSRQRIPFLMTLFIMIVFRDPLLTQDTTQGFSASEIDQLLVIPTDILGNAITLRL